MFAVNPSFLKYLCNSRTINAILASILDKPLLVILSKYIRNYQLNNCVKKTFITFISRFLFGKNEKNYKKVHSNLKLAALDSIQQAQ